MSRRLATPTARSPQAWFALHFPAIALAAVPSAATAPRAVHAAAGRRDLVVAADAAALAAGVCPGLPVGSALVRLPGLQLVPRDAAAEAALLAVLAGRCTVFTPAVSVAPDALLLEVRASLRLFGGAAALAARLASTVAGHAVQLAAAPTALAALWLARAGRTVYDLGPANLPGVLAGLPVTCTGWPADALELLARIGVRTLGELSRLPRAGLAQRLGQGRLRELDEAYGRSPGRYRWHVPGTDFHAVAELPADSTDTGTLLAACERLFADLAALLVRRQAGVRRVWCSLRHAGLPDRRPPDSRVRITLRRATADTGQLRQLLALQLDQLALPAPVAAVALQATLVADCPATTVDWPTGTRGSSERLAAVLDRLRARLGDRSVRGIALCPDHRPEQAWQWTAALPGAGAERLPVIAGRRPPWLLASPRRLPSVAGQPRLQGALRFAAGPERIETGWWDGGDVRRDYFVASCPRGRRFWIFRDLRDGGWYLHGIFR